MKQIDEIVIKLEKVQPGQLACNTTILSLHGDIEQCFSFVHSKNSHVVRLVWHSDSTIGEILHMPPLNTKSTKPALYAWFGLNGASLLD